MHTRPRRSRLFVSLLVLLGIVVPILQTGIAGQPVAAQSDDVILDLPAMALTPADLEEAGLPGFGQARYDDANPGWRTIGDVVFDSPAANFLCCLDKIDRLNLELSRTGWQRQYRRLLARVSPLDSTSADYLIFSEVGEYADAAGADAALTLLMDNGDTTPSESLEGDRMEGRGDFLLDVGGRGVIMFRHDNLLATLQIINHHDGVAIPRKTLQLLPTIFRQRIVSALDRPKTGLSSTALRLASIASPAEYDTYWRLNEQDIPEWGESSEDAAAYGAQTYPDALDVYHLEQSLIPPPGQPISPRYDVRVLRFGRTDAASAWLTALPPKLEEDVANSDGTLALDLLTDAQTVGDESLTYQVSQEKDGATVHGYRIYFRVGKYTARIQFDAAEAPSLPVVETLAEAQVACFQAGRCDGPTRLPADLEGLSCPPSTATTEPRFEDFVRNTAEVPMPGADPARTGAQPGPGPSRRPRELWHFATSGGSRGPILADDRLYLGAFGPAENPSQLYALDPDTGTLRWCQTTGWDVTDPSFGDGLLFTQAAEVTGGHRQTAILALSAATGEERWQFSVYPSWNTNDHGVSVANGSVYVNSGNGSLFAIDESTGAGRWLHEVHSEGKAKEFHLGLPAIAGGVVYIAAGTTLYALDEATGEELWRYVTDDETESLGTPSVAGDFVFIGGEHAVYAVDAKSGKGRWASSSESTGGNRLAVVAGVVYVGTGSRTEAAGDAAIFALDAGNGDRLWRIKSEGYVSTPAVAGDTVYVGTGVQRTEGEQEGALLAIAADGEELWSFPVDGLATAPVVAGGRVYVAAETGTEEDMNLTLYAVGGTSKK